MSETNDFKILEPKDPKLQRVISLMGWSAVEAQCDRLPMEHAGDYSMAMEILRRYSIGEIGPRSELLEKLKQAITEMRDALLYIETYGGEVTKSYRAGGNVSRKKDFITECEQLVRQIEEDS